MKPTFYVRFRWPIVLVTLALLPPMLYGALKALENNHNDVIDWLPVEFEETKVYAWFYENFQSEEIALVSWPNCNLDNPQLNELADGLLAAKVRSGPFEGQPLFRKVLTGPRLLDELTSPPLRLSREEAIERLRTVIIGYDGKLTAAICMVDEAGRLNRELAVERIYELATKITGLPADQIHLGGPTVDNVAIDTESQSNLYILAAISAVAALLVAWRCLRNLWLTLMVFVSALISEVLCVAVVHYSGRNLDAILIMMPTVVYVCALSGAIHLVNYYRDAVPIVGRARASLQAVKNGWLPCTLAAVTTSVGLGSLAMSQVVPVRNFGIYSAIGVTLTLLMLFTFLPAVLPSTPRKDDELPSEDEETIGNFHRRNKWINRYWRRHALWVMRNHGKIVIGCLMAIGLLAIGAVQINTSVKLQDLFSPRSQVMHDYAWLEQNIGPLVPVEVVIRFEDGCQLNFLERLEVVDEVQRQLQAIEKVGGSMSVATFAPPLPEGTGTRLLLRRRALEKRLEDSRQQFIDARYLKPVEGEELWRVSARVEALNDIDYGDFVVKLKQVVEPVLAAQQQAGITGVSATYTGVMPLIYKSQRQLLDDLSSSFLTAFLLIALSMTILLRGPRSGVLSMLPNIFPVMVIFGGMGWAGVKVDIGSMMTASVALGIAVDDTLHFLTWYYRGLAEGMQPRRAVRNTYLECATAMLQTTLVISLGLMVFSISTFMPTARFSWLMFFMLGAALIGDLVLLPAMLVGPLGRYFGRRKPNVLLNAAPTSSPIAAPILRPTTM